MKKLKRITIFVICTLLLLIGAWIVAWKQFGNNLIRHYYVKTIDKYGGVSAVNNEAINIYDRIKLGFDFRTEIYGYNKELFPILSRLGIVDYEYKSIEIPSHVYIVLGCHFHKYHLEIYDPRIQDNKIESRGIEIFKNVRLVGWTWHDRFRFME